MTSAVVNLTPLLTGAVLLYPYANGCGWCDTPTDAVERLVSVPGASLEIKCNGVRHLILYA